MFFLRLFETRCHGCPNPSEDRAGLGMDDSYRGLLVLMLRLETLLVLSRALQLARGRRRGRGRNARADGEASPVGTSTRSKKWVETVRRSIA